LLNRFNVKGKKSGIFITSSIAARIAVPGVTTYCANKGFATMFGQGIQPELAGKVDVLVYEPGTIATKMLGQGPSFTAITPEMAAECSLRHMGMGR
jgi:short-subunit dehydrogenase